MAYDNLPLLIGGAGLVEGSVKGFGPALAELSHEVSDSIVSRGWIDGAPFNVVSLIVRYGQISKPRVEIGGINRHDELEVAVQAGFDELRAAKGNVSELKEALRPYISNALAAVAERYELGNL